MEFRWEDLNWHRDGVYQYTIFGTSLDRGVIHVRRGVLFEVWTHDKHHTYTVLVSYLDGTPLWCLAVGVPKLEALCVAIEWFKKNT